MRLSVRRGSQSVRLPVSLRTAYQTPATGLTNSTSGLVCSYWRSSDGNAGATAVTLASATRGTYTSGGFVEKDGTNAPGEYEFGVPNAALADGAEWVVVVFKDGSGNLIGRVHIDLVDEVSSAASVGVAQAGASQSITLAATEPSDVGSRVGAVVRVIAGVGAGQSRIITSYNTTTKLAGVDRVWSVVPDSTSRYLIDGYPGVPLDALLSPTSNISTTGQNAVRDAVWSKVIVGGRSALTFVRLIGGALFGAKQRPMADKIEIYDLGDGSAGTKIATLNGLDSEGITATATTVHV